MMYNWNNIDDTVNRYVCGVMSADETDRFEEYFLGRPEVIWQIEVDQLMRAGLQDLPVAAPVHRTDGESQPASWRRWLEQLFRPENALPMAGAYVGSLLALGVALIWFVVEPQSSAERMFSRANIANVHVLVLEKRRSGESSNVVQLTSADQKFVLLLDLYPPILTAYEMQIARTDASEPVPIPRIVGLVPDQNERLSVVLDANLLPPGEYLLSFLDAEGGPQQQALDTFELSVRGPEEN